MPYKHLLKTIFSQKSDLESKGYNTCNDTRRKNILYESCDTSKNHGKASNKLLKLETMQ